jgi:hypothetical protein
LFTHGFGNKVSVSTLLPRLGRKPLPFAQVIIISMAVSRLLCVDLACSLIQLPVVYASIFGGIALIIFLSIEKYDCSHAYDLWQCMHNCNVSAHTNATLCSNHSGETGVDLGLISLAVSTASAVLSILCSLLTVVKIFLSGDGYMQKDFHLKLVGYLAISDFALSASIIMGTSPFLQPTFAHTQITRCSTYGPIVMMFGAFSTLGVFLWHSIIVASVYLMVSNSELYFRWTKNSFYFIYLSIGVWGVSAALALAMWLGNDFVPIVIPRLDILPCEVSKLSLYSITVQSVFSIGLLLSFFVCMYTFRKLDLRLLRTGDSR